MYSLCEIDDQTVTQLFFEALFYKKTTTFGDILYEDGIISQENLVTNLQELIRKSRLSRLFEATRFSAGKHKNPS